MANNDWHQERTEDDLVRVSDGTETYYSKKHDGENWTLEEIADDFVDDYDFNGENVVGDEIALKVEVTNLETNKTESFTYRGSYFQEGDDG
jgi:hypothetical protein